MNFFKRRTRAAAKTYNAYRRLFSTEDGKIVLQDLMNACNFLKPSIGETPDDTYFNEGKRSVVLSIMQTSSMTTEEINKLIENVEKQNKELMGGTDDFVQ
jgi:hypothetical protein